MSEHQATGLSDVMGMTGQAIIRAIVAGERDPKLLARHRHSGVMASTKEITPGALTGNWCEEQAPDRRFSREGKVATEVAGAKKFDYHNRGTDTDMMTRLRTERFKGAADVGLFADVGGEVGQPPVILLHGGGQTRYSWGKAMLDLVESGHHVISLDLRGHGESDWAGNSDYSLNAFVADLEAVIATLDRPPMLVGASLGGATALVAVGEHRGRLAEAMVLVDQHRDPDLDHAVRPFVSRAHLPLLGHLRVSNGMDASTRQRHQRGAASPTTRIGRAVYRSMWLLASSPVKLLRLYSTGNAHCRIEGAIQALPARGSLNGLIDVAGTD